MNKGTIHEAFAEFGEEKKATEQSLGKVFAGVCALVAAFRWYHDKAGVVWWLLAAAIFMCCAYFFPATLKPLNRFWMKLGAVLFSITNPIIMGIIFFGTVMPTGLVMRLLGKDPMKMKLDKHATSYWVLRSPAGPKGEEMKNQF